MNVVQWNSFVLCLLFKTFIILETTASANSEVTKEHLLKWNEKQQWEVKQISRKFASKIGLSRKPTVIEAGWEPFGSINKYTYLRRPIETASVNNSENTEKIWENEQQWEVKPITKNFAAQLGFSKKPIIIESGWEPFGSIRKVTYVRRPFQNGSIKKSNLAETWDDKQQWEVKTFSRKFSTFGISTKPVNIEAGWEPFDAMHKVTYLRRPVQSNANQKSNLSKNWDKNQRWEVKAVEKKFSAQLGLAIKPETIEAGWEPFGSTHKFTYVRRPVYN